MGGIIGVTGTPGTGKKTVAPLIARLMGFSCVALNELTPSKAGARHDQETEVDTQELKKRLREIPRSSVVYGHLLPYSMDPEMVRRVVVLRCEPLVLRRRLLDRGYSLEKVGDNVEAELIGLVSADSYEAFGDKSFEVDTTLDGAEKSASRSLAVIRGSSKPGPRIDWTESYDAVKLRALLPPSGA